MTQKIQAIRGMNDVLPADSHQWEYFENILRGWLADYGYQNIRTPIVEETRLFVRSIGEVTDIVEKEMYSFTDSLNGDSLTLRPEGTAGTLRAVVEHNLLYNATQRLWYMGPMFRHERPQKGRYRQFHQIGIEALGFAGPDIDAEIILMTADLWKRLGLADSVELQLNTLGNKDERAAHREALIAYLERHHDMLDEDGKRRLYSNPLRVLDTKNPALQEICNAAPRLTDYLGDESRAHYEGWKAMIDGLGIRYVENPRLVRGLDYYNQSVFEWVTTELGAAGYGVCRWSLRRPGRATRRQAGSRHRLRHGPGAGDAAVAGKKPPAGIARGGRLPGAAGCWRAAVRHAAGGQPACRRPVGDSALRRRQFQVANEKGRRLWRAVCRDRR